MAAKATGRAEVAGVRSGDRRAETIFEYVESLGP
jgi:hypothetical protein